MKLTTKLLLGATVVAGLSVSAFAACANHVDMGTKNLTNVAEPTETHHAATKGYVDNILSPEVQVVYVNMSDANVSDTSTDRLRWVMVGKMVCLTGIVRNYSDFVINVPIPLNMRSSVSPGIPVNRLTQNAIASNSGSASGGYIRRDDARIFGQVGSGNEYLHLGACYIKE